VTAAVHSYGGLVLHDVINQTFAKKAVEKGADGLILVAAGAGGHAGKQSPFALVQETRRWFDGPIALSGSIATGDAVLAAEAMGADFGYIGSPFIATAEANASAEYQQAIVEASAEDIVYTNFFSGIHGNYLKASVRAAGMDPDALPEADPSKMDFGTGGATSAKVWKDIWGCGQGIGDYVARLRAEYAAARARLGLAHG
nr:nitronate monooxygenase [Xanthomonadales bacterium]